MEFQVLGRLGYRVDADWVRPRGAVRSRLLGVLLARAGQVVSHDTLSGALWPGESTPRTAERTVGRLHLHAHRLRQDLDRPDRLVADRSGYVLQVGADEVDAVRFEGLAGQTLGAAVDDPRRADLARRALDQWPDRWAGLAFPGLDVPLVTDAADRLGQLRLDVMEVLFDAEIRRGRHLDVLADLQRVAGEHPLREPLQACLMRALHQAGRPAEALAVYARTRQHLVDELGLEPSISLRELQGAVLGGRADRSTRPSAPTAPPPPAQLPPTVPLVGRDAALRELDRALLDRAVPLALVTGLPGVGKSALAISWAAQHSEQYADGQLFVDLRSYSPGPERDVEEVLDRFIRALGGSPGALRDLDERAATYRSLLAGRRVVIVLDNARSEDQIRPFLPGQPGCTLLVTSRDQLSGLVARDGASRLDLEPLGSEESVQLLRSLVGTSPVGPRDDPAGQGDDLHELASRCAGLPVALRVAALRQDLRQGPTGPEEVLDLLDVGDPMTSARTIISWSVDSLAPELLDLFLALGVDPGSRVDVGGLAALADIDPAAARAGLDRLVRGNLVHRSEDWVWQHDLLAAYARERATAALDEDERERMLERLLGYYEPRLRAAVGAPEQAEAEFGSSRAAAVWVDHALQPIVELVERAPESADPVVIDLSRHLNQGLKARGEHRLARRLWESALLAAERSGDRSATARVLQALASVTATLGERPLSDRLWDRARRLALESGDPGVQLVVHNNYANVLLSYGQLPRARAHLERALRLARRTQDPREETVRGNLGLLLVKLEQDELAADRLRDNLERASGPAWRARLLRDRAMLGLRRGRVAEASVDLREALTLATQTSSWVLATEIRVMQGQALCRQGDPEGARPLVEQAMRDAMQQDEQVEVVECLIALGRIDMVDDPQAAAVRLEEALGRSRREGAREMEFRTMLVMADLYDQEGQHMRAEAVRRTAGQVRAECGLPAEQTYEAW